MQSYSLDLITLLQILSRQRQSGLLQAEMAHLPGSRQPGIARLEIVEGSVYTCTMYLKGGSIYAEGSKAYQMVSDAGSLEWIWSAYPSPRTPQQVIPFSPSENNTSSLSQLVPRQTVQLDAGILNRLPRSHRRVLVLIDGIRTIGKIASMLALTDDNELLTILRELQTEGLVILGAIHPGRF